MGWLEAVVLGAVQGLTEFLPVSSTAHLSLVGRLFFGGHDPGASFSAVIQLGTNLAVLLYFWGDIVRIVKAWALSLVGKVPRSDPDARLGWFVILGSIPIGVLGLLFQNQIETSLRNLWVTVAMLAGVGVVLWIADRYAATHSTKTIDTLTLPDAIVYGLCQATALIPGVSRSGGTIAGGLFLGYTRAAAARYSFLLSLPAIWISGLYQLKGLDTAGVTWGPTIVATLIAFVVGFAVIAWLLRFISTHDFRPFVIYRWALALAVAGLLLGGVLAPVGT
ncbi:MAG: undecaprenyl-diphosphate phosphatase [Actinomycetia bacterium]|nr:undecaprenyl-diphosphate phosphatase [Actinomycetes bacterium]